MTDVVRIALTMQGGPELQGMTRRLLLALRAEIDVIVAEMDTDLTVAQAACERAQASALPAGEAAALAMGEPQAVAAEDAAIASATHGTLPIDARDEAMLACASDLVAIEPDAAAETDWAPDNDQSMRDADACPTRAEAVTGAATNERDTVEAQFDIAAAEEIFDTKAEPLDALAPIVHGEPELAQDPATADARQAEIEAETLRLAHDAPPEDASEQPAAEAPIVDPVAGEPVVEDTAEPAASVVDFEAYRQTRAATADASAPVPHRPRRHWAAKIAACAALLIAGGLVLAADRTAWDAARDLADKLLARAEFVTRAKAAGDVLDWQDLPLGQARDDGAGSRAEGAAAGQHLSDEELVDRYRQAWPAGS